MSLLPPVITLIIDGNRRWFERSIEERRIPEKLGRLVESVAVIIVDIVMKTIIILLCSGAYEILYINNEASVQIQPPTTGC